MKQKAATYKGKPCKKCGSTERYVSSRACMKCSLERSRINKRLRYASDPDYRRNIIKQTSLYQKEHPEIRRKIALKRDYGISVEDYDRMLANQCGACAICGSVPKTHLHVDHSHESGGVRGLLCGPCNRAIGLMKEDEASLRAAIVYLQTHKEQCGTNRRSGY